MKVRVQYFASVREVVDLREEVIEVPNGAAVRSLLDVLAAKHGTRLKEYLFDKNGDPRAYLQFILDEKSISEKEGFSTLLNDGATLAIIPPVGGG